MKKILVITGREVYPLWGGDRLRIHKICEYLSHFFELHLVSLTDTKSFSYSKNPAVSNVFSRATEFYHPPQKAYKSVLRNLAGRRSMQENYYSNEALHSFLSSEAPKYDFVLCHLFRMEQYLRYFDPRKVVVELTDSLGMNYSRLSLKDIRSFIQFLYFLEKGRVIEREVEIINSYEKCVLISDIDKQYLVRHGAYEERLYMFNNGVDTTSFKNAFSPEFDNKIVFIGNINARHNFDACLYFSKEVMPLLIGKYPDLKFKIIGQIGRELQNKLSVFPYNELTGSVESIHEHIGNPLCGVCPTLYGAGIQNKILEYFASGIPVISSPIGAEGLTSEAQDNLIIADSPHKYKLAVQRLIENQGFREEMSQKGLSIVRESYNWEQKLSGYEKLFEENIL